MKRRPYSQRNAGMREINTAYPAYDGHMPVIVCVFCASKETQSERTESERFIDREKDCMSPSLSQRGLITLKK